ncbi:MAG TPA: SIR2 family protein [Flavitalea sp.]|nr:SIR2 family protein [Flavitalea sp.]
MKKLLVITGAGASIDFGMPSVHFIDSLFEGWAQECALLKHDPSKSLYTWVKDNMWEYCIQNKRNRMNMLMGFENLLFVIQHLAAMGYDREWQHFNNRILPFVKMNELPAVISFKRERIASGGEFSFLQSWLVDQLLNYFRRSCGELEKTKSAEIEKLQSFFIELKRSFDIGFVNLNYDNVVLTALPDLQTGFDLSDGSFKRDLLYDKKWNFCYHLHGSVHFDMLGGKGMEMHKIFWNKDLNSKFTQNSSGRSAQATAQGINHLTSSIITGLDKANQILREPFASYFMQMDRLIYESDAILFIGYGFADEHLNSLFPFIRYDGRKRKVVVIDYATDDEDGLHFRQDDWTYGLFSAIPSNAYEMGDGKHAWANATSYFKSRNLLEKSINQEYPLAIWYNGLLKACEHPDTVLAELE